VTEENSETKPNQLTPEEVLERTNELISNMCSEARADALAEFLGKVGIERYLYAPASSKLDHHNCFAGGLALHNLNVFQFLVELDALRPREDFTTETLCVVAILHDIGKLCNTDLGDYYVPTTERWKLERGEEYTPTQGKIYLTTQQRTMWLISHFGFSLTAEEYQAILLNDGQYIDENKIYRNHECDLAKLLHMADMMACMKESGKTS
jgi:hypothetical protein